MAISAIKMIQRNLAAQNLKPDEVHACLAALVDDYNRVLDREIKLSAPGCNGFYGGARRCGPGQATIRPAHGTQMDKSPNWPINHRIPPERCPFVIVP